MRYRWKLSKCTACEGEARLRHSTYYVLKMQSARGYANLEETVIRVIPRINLTPHAFTAVVLSGYSQP